MRRSAAAALSFHLCLLMTPLAASVTVIENTPQRFTFRWHAAAPDTSTIFMNDRPVTSLSFSDNNFSVENAGEPVRPAYSFTVGVPATGAVSASVTVTSGVSIALNHPPFIIDEKDAQPEAAVSFTGPWISQPQYIQLRTLRAATFIFCPVQYNLDNNTCSFITDGTCTVTFPASTARPRKGAPTNDYEKMMRHLVANYDVATGWAVQKRLAKKHANDYPLPPGRTSFSFTVGDGHTEFNECTINENGMMKIDGAHLQELFGSSIAMNKVRLYASWKNMLPDTLPADGSIPDGVTEIPLLRIDRNGNGNVDNNDCVIGYVSGASDWVFRSRYTFRTNLYTDYRTYWVTASESGARSLQKIAQAEGDPALTRDVSFNFVRFKQSKYRKDDDHGSRNWLWKMFDRNQQPMTVSLDLPHIDTSLPGSISFKGYSKNRGYVKVSLAGTIIDTSSAFDDSVDVTEWGDRQLTFTNNGGTDSAKTDLDYFDAKYREKLAVGDDPATITIFPEETDTGFVVAWDLQISTRQKVYIMRVDQDEQEMRLVDTVSMAQNGTFRFTDTAFAGRRYVICNESGLLPLPETTAPDDHPSTTSMQVTNLRSTANRSDFLIIAHPDFLAAADSLARHKKHIGFKNPVVVNVFDIYRYFSGGNKDAAAIRNFIGYVTRYWDNALFPDYVILFGTGHYDAKNLKNTATDFIPAYIVDNENYENFFTRVAVTNDETEDVAQIAIGRFPCLTVEQGWDMVYKVVDTEDPAVADFSEWRNRALFVADDDMQGAEPDPVSSTGYDHAQSSDRTAALLDSLAPSIDLRKVYLYEYEWDQLRQKPGASIALINEINNGVGYINFFGHGADITWTDEFILTAEMIARMNNSGRYPIVSAFSCSVGHFDNPGRQCLSGTLVTSRSAGAVTTVSSTRESGASGNQDLAFAFYSSLFDSTSPHSAGDALIYAQVVLRDSGHRTYCILGDPSIRAIRPTRTVNLTLDDRDDTLRALQKVTVSGTVTKADGSIDRDFTGKGAHVAVGLFNAAEVATRKDGGTRFVTYTLPGTPLFLGKTDVTGGTFKQTVLVPQNLTFDKAGPRMTAYAWIDNNTISGTGSKKPITFHGSLASGNISDRTGPLISVRPSYDDDRLSGGNASFSDHITVQVPFTAEIEIFDSSGIDAAGIGPDEGITVEIEGTMPRQNFNSKFQFKEGDYRRGIVSVVYDEDVLKPGTYTMAVTARDLIGNLSKKTFDVTVIAYDSLDLDHVINYPNPARYGKQTRFYCQSSYTSETYWKNDLHLTIKIYTLAGRLLRVIRDARNGEVWDLRDERGAPLSPDIYLWQVTAEDYKLKKTKKSDVCKLVIAPPK